MNCNKKKKSGKIVKKQPLKKKLIKTSNIGKRVIKRISAPALGKILKQKLPVVKDVVLPNGQLARIVGNA
jgi:hypothetical protein